jgi:demethylmenaquinone methyltransferase/2-methoxy-6-polyprenyl-1,4-benzoquinol methylase
MAAREIMSAIPAGTGKEAYIEGLFSSIAPRYDLLNSVLSLSRHKAWRRFAAAMTGLEPGGRALDVCCGTGDFAFELARLAGPSGRVVGADFSMPMIELAARKARRRGVEQVEFVVGNACSLPFADQSFDCATVGFGLRNVADVGAALSEMARVTKPGGKVVSLEITRVSAALVALPWRLYFYSLAPRAARVFRGRREAYEYLAGSVRSFMSREDLAAEFVRAGLRDVAFRDLTLGVVCVHVGTKPGGASSTPT